MPRSGENTNVNFYDESRDTQANRDARGFANFLAPGSIPKNIDYPSQIANQNLWSGITQAGAQAAPNANPYSAIVANQARPAQEALYAQMRVQQAGPSVAAMQGQRAQGQNLQAALGAGGGRPMMARAGGIGAGLAGDTGMGRLAEQLRMSQGLGGMSGGVRGTDIGVANAQSQTGLQQRGLDDAMRQFYASQGAGFENTMSRADLENYKLAQRRQLGSDAAVKKSTDNLIGFGATLLGSAL